jgi:putative NIF3 family GTP cyclohydrolase 1 type 2
VPSSDPKGALTHRLIRAGSAHFVAHTNADVAAPGVSDALAERLGLRELRPLSPQDDPAFAKLVVFVPSDSAAALVDALAAAGAGRLGDYDRCAWMSEGVGTFRPLAGANPTIGTVGVPAEVPETRVEMIVRAADQRAVLSALRGAHPYEEPAFDLLAQLPLPSGRGTGRVGELSEPTTVAGLAALVAARLPATTWGVRAAGDPDRPVRTVAVCGGSGGSLIDYARAAGADVYVTADLKHHPALEATTERGPDAMALVDAAHWATEAPWLDALATRLRAAFELDVRVSRLCTDPWTRHEPSVH